MKLRTRIYKFGIRLRTCINILFVYKHWFIINLNSEQLKNLLSGNDFECDVVHHGMLRYNVNDIMLKLGSAINDVDHILDKAEFEAKATLYKAKNN